MEPAVSPEQQRDIGARALICVLFGLLCANIFRDFMATGHVTGLLLLASESLVVVLTVVRRRARFTDHSMAATITTIISVAGPPLLRPGSAPALVPDAVTAALSAIGLIIVIVGKMTLGRSFGIAPANRGVVIGGPYGIVRHPIYTGYLVTHVGFVVAHPSAVNITVLLIADGALIIRALIEERVLGSDAAYRAYCQRVAWHLVPGLF